MSMIHDNRHDEVIVVAVDTLPKDGSHWLHYPDLAVLAISRRIGATELQQALAAAGVR